MMRSAVGLLLLLLWLSPGCVTTERAQLATWPKHPEGATPQLFCIFALDDDHAWTGGHFRSPAVTLHSMMYRTCDGGKSWQPVGPAISNSTIFSIHFIDSQTGWAVGAWTTESTGEPFVLRTTDGGQSWIRSDIPMKARPTPLFAPQSIDFVTRKHGMVRASSCVVEDEQAVYVTHDGGQNWSFSHGRHEASGPCNHLSVTKTGILWKIIDDRVVLVSSDDGMTWQRTRGQPIKE